MRTRSSSFASAAADGPLSGPVVDANGVALPIGVKPDGATARLELATSIDDRADFDALMVVTTRGSALGGGGNSTAYPSTGAGAAQAQRAHDRTPPMLRPNLTGRRAPLGLFEGYSRFVRMGCMDEPSSYD
jgi:hypothetical protein